VAKTSSATNRSNSETTRNYLLHSSNVSFIGDILWIYLQGTWSRPYLFVVRLMHWNGDLEGWLVGLAALRQAEFLVVGGNVVCQRPRGQRLRRRHARAGLG